MDDTSTVPGSSWDDEPDTDPAPGQPTMAVDGLPRPVVWEGLDTDEAEFEWLVLNEWVEDLRRTFSIPATIVPPFWRRRSLLVEQPSALHMHWLAAYEPDRHGSASFGWIRDLDEWKTRMSEVVAQLGCRLDQCRPETITHWPGEPNLLEWPPPINLADRYDGKAAHQSGPTTR